LEKISKEEFNFLIEKGILKQSKGSYGDSLIIIGKFGSGLKKQRYITTPTYNYLLRLQEQKVTDINKVKDNQRYLFSSSSVS
jgi:hypothetical protein